MREQVLYAEYGVEVIKLESASADFIASLFKLGIEDIDAKIFEPLILAYQSGNCNFDIEDSIGHYLRCIYKRASSNTDNIKNHELLDVIAKYSVFFESIVTNYDGVFGEKIFIPRRLFDTGSGAIDEVFLEDCPLIPWDFFSVSEYYAACNILNIVGVLDMWYLPLLDIVRNSRFTNNREYYNISDKVDDLLKLS